MILPKVLSHRVRFWKFWHRRISGNNYGIEFWKFWIINNHNFFCHCELVLVWRHSESTFKKTHRWEASPPTPAGLGLCDFTNDDLLSKVWRFLVWKNQTDKNDFGLGLFMGLISSHRKSPSLKRDLATTDHPLLKSYSLGCVFPMVVVLMQNSDEMTIGKMHSTLWLGTGYWCDTYMLCCVWGYGRFGRPRFDSDWPLLFGSYIFA